MKNEPIITNRFTPGPPTPIFFAGRQREFTTLFSALNNFMTSHSSTRSIHLLAGKSGVGKSTFLSRFKHQVQTTSEFAKYITVYMSLEDVLDDPSNFCKIFLQEVEKSITNSVLQRQAITQSFTSEVRFEKLRSIAPDLNLERLDFSGRKLASFASLFQILREHYKDPDRLEELVFFWSWILKENNLFLLWIIDHFETLKTAPEFLPILTPVLNKLHKRAWHYFTLIGIEKEALESLQKIDSPEKTGLSPFFSSQSTFYIRNEINHAIYWEKLKKTIAYGESMPWVAISSSANSSKVLSTFEKGADEDFLLIKLEAESTTSYVKYVETTALKLAKEFEKIAKNIYGVIRENFYTEVVERHCQVKPMTLDVVMKALCKVIKEFDKFLVKQSKKELIIIWGNFDQLINSSNSSGDVTKRISSSRMLFSDRTNDEREYLLPTPTFIRFFSALSNCLYDRKRITLVSLLNLSPQEFPQKDHLTINALFEFSTIWELDSLSEKNSVQLLQEIAARSGVIMNEKICEDIFKRAEGNALLMQHFGYYILYCLQENIPHSYVENIRKHLFKKFDDNLDDQLKKMLAPGPDGRARLLLSSKFYQRVVPKNSSNLYEQLIHIIEKDVPFSVIKKIIQSPEAVSVASMEYLLEDPTNEKSKDIKEIVQKCQDLKLIEKQADKIKLSHPLIREHFSTLINRQKFEAKIPSQEAFPKTIRRKDSPLGARSLQGGSLTPMPSDFKKQQLLTKGLSLLQQKTLPTRTFLDKISPYLILQPAAPFFKVCMQYIYTLSSMIIKKVGIHLDIAKVVSEIKNRLEKQGKELDLAKVLLKVILSEKQIEIGKKDQNRWFLSKLYFFRYRFTEDVDELQLAIENFIYCYVENSTDFEMKEFSWEIEKNVREIPDSQQGKLWQESLKEILRLQSFTNLYDAHGFGKELERLAPLRVSRRFHKYFISYLQSLICGENTPDIIQAAALKLFGYYGHLVPSQPEMIVLLKECLHASHQIKVRKAAASSLSYLLAYFNSEQRLEILALLEQVVAQEKDSEIRYYLAEILAKNSWVIPHDEVAAFFHELLHRDPDLTIQAKAWEVLASIQSFCEPTLQEDISELLIEYYHKLLQERKFYKIGIYTEVLLIAIRKNADLINKASKWILEGLECYDIHGPFWHNSIVALPVMFCTLPAEKKKSVGNLLQGWLTGNQPQKKILAISMLNLFHPYIEELDLIIEKILSADFSEFQRSLYGNFWKWIGSLKEQQHNEITSKIIELCKTSLQLPQCVDNYAHYITDAGSLSPYFSEEQIDSLGMVIENGLKSGFSKAVEATVESLPVFFNFASSGLQEYLERKVANLLVPGTTSPTLLAKLLKLFSYTSVVPTEVCDKMKLTWIHDQMNLYPEILLESALEFFANIWDNLPSSLSASIKQDALHYLMINETTESALAFLIKCMGAMPEFSQRAYFYQFSTHTIHLAFALYEIFPELADTVDLVERYEKMLCKTPYFLAPKLANFHFHAQIFERAEEWVDWALEQARLPFIKEKALSIRLKWQILHRKKIETRKTLAKYHEISLGIAKSG